MKLAVLEKLQEESVDPIEVSWHLLKKFLMSGLSVLFIKNQFPNFNWSYLDVIVLNIILLNINHNRAIHEHKVSTDNYSVSPEST